VENKKGESILTEIDDMRSKMNTQKPEKKPETKVETKEEIKQRLKDLETKEKALEVAEKQSPVIETKKRFSFRKEKISEEDKKRDQDIVDDYKEAQGKLKRRERKMIDNREFEGTKLRNNAFLTMAIVGLFFIMFLYVYMKLDWMFIIILLLGSMMFLPVGMILGWALLDPYVRTKIIRKMTHRNYGIINFVGKGQKMISKVKNFDQALVWKKNEVWIITKEHVYQLSKDGDSVVEKGKIEPESIVTIIDTVPVLFVDLDSMQPLSLARDRREGINPLELGATLKAWVDNQLAKAMFLKKTYDIYFFIVIGAAIGSILFGYVNMTKLDSLIASMKILSDQVTAILNQLPPAVP
jgi:hypothetical protein